MSAEIVPMPGTTLQRAADDDNALCDWLKSEILPERPEGEIARVTLHRADHQGHAKARFKTVALPGKPGVDRLQDIAAELALAAERDARGPLGAPIYLARLWTAAGADAVSEIPFVPSQAGQQFAGGTQAQAQTALLGQVYQYNGELMRRSVAMMVAQTAFADRQIERMEAETKLLREQSRRDAQDLEEARTRAHERKLEADAAAARQKRGDEVFGMVKSGIDMIVARWSPAGTPTTTVIAERVVEFVDGLDQDTRDKLLGALASQFRAKFEQIVEMARDGAGDTQLGRRLVRFFDAVPEAQRVGMLTVLSQPQQMKVGAIADLAAKAAKVDVSDGDEEKKA